MKTAKILAILVLGLMVCKVKVSEAAPMGTAFTYQGRLMDANDPADGLYDLQFKLFDDANVVDGNQVGEDVNKPDVDVIDGYFTVLLDFSEPNSFDGDARWLEVVVRPGDSNDANDFVALVPRQEVTPAPYALYAQTGPGDYDWKISGNDMYSIPNGNVGIGIMNPWEKLTILQDFASTNRVEDLLNVARGSTGTVARGIGAGIIFSNEVENAGYAISGRIASVMEDITVANMSAGMLFEIRDSGFMVDAFYLDSEGNVGVGTRNPGGKLAVNYDNGNPTKAAILIDNSNVIGHDVLDFRFLGTTQARIRKANGGGLFIGTEDLQPVNLYVAGATRMVIQNDGSVGLGTTNPQNKLDVEGAMVVGAGYSGTETAPSNGMVIQGNVGIGTTSPADKLDVEGNISVSGKATIGSGHTNTGNYAFVAGESNTASGSNSSVCGGLLNTVSGSYSSVGGGNDNEANNLAATVGGGIGNLASGSISTIAGGNNNTASGPWSTVAGGLDNTAGGDYASIGGGINNTVNFPGNYASIAGGKDNTVTVSGAYGMIPGGSLNTVSGWASFAAGYRAKANHGGTFVWADSWPADFASFGNNTFNVRASGGTRIYSDTAASVGVRLNNGANAWAALSDRNVKDNFAFVDGQEILEQLASIPIETWNLKSQDESIRHIGPMAQDFYTAFGVGEDERHISTTDADGVALAAIQRLYQLAQEKDAEIAVLKKRNEKVEARLAVMEEKMMKLEAVLGTMQ
jgi:hypothetical protein